MRDIPDGPVAHPGVRMIHVPGYRVDMAGAASLLRQEGVDAGPFVGAAGGSAKVAAAIAEHQKIYAKLLSQMADSKEQADLSRAETIFADTRAAHAREIGGKPEEEWVNLWDQKYRPQLDKELAKLRMTAETGERVSLMLRKFDADTRREVTYSAFKTRAERDKQAILNGINREMDAGNYEGAMEGTMRLELGHHVTPEQGEKMRDELEERAREANYAQWMNDDPNGFIQALEADELILTPVDKLRLQQQAGGLGRKQSREEMEALDNDILTGKVRTEEEVRRRGAEARMSERDIQSFVEGLMVAEQNSPEGRARYMAAYDRLWQDSLNYDPGDDADGTKALGLLRSIRTQVTPGERQPLLDNLRAGQREGRTTARQREAALEEQIDVLQRHGLLAVRPQNPADPAALAASEQAAILKAARLKQDARAWLKRNPKATPAEVSAWFNESMIGEVSDNLLNGMPKRFHHTP